MLPHSGGPYLQPRTTAFLFDGVSLFPLWFIAHPDFERYTTQTALRTLQDGSLAQLTSVHLRPGLPTGIGSAQPSTQSPLRPRVPPRRSRGTLLPMQLLDEELFLFLQTRLDCRDFLSPFSPASLSPVTKPGFFVVKGDRLIGTASTRRPKGSDLSSSLSIL